MSDMNDFNRQIINEFRTNAGQVGGPFRGSSVLLLHSTGARSGQERVHPLVYQPVDGGAMAIFGSKGGAPTSPAWYHNLMAHPDAVVEIGTDTVPVRAREAGPDERERIWTRQKEVAPAFAGYESKTSRVIPVVILEPRS